MASEQPIGGLARGACRPEDRAIVFPQDFKPCADIVGMADGGGDAERGAEEGRSHFRDQFLAGVVLRSEGVDEIAPQPVGVTGGVTIMPISA